MKKTILTGIGTLAMLSSSVISVLADTNVDLKTGDLALGNVEALTIPGIITAVIKFIVVAASIIFFLMLLVGGIQWIMSGGDKAGTEAARGRITAALIGLVIILAAWAIVTLMGTFFGIELLDLTIPTVKP